MKVKKPGFIYCFSHPMLTLALGENVYKLGRTVSVDSRAKSAKTFMAEGMECLHKEEVVHDVDAEKMLFEMLTEFRVRDDREFFQIELPYVKRVMRSVSNEINTREYQYKRERKIIKKKVINTKNKIKLEKTVNVDIVGHHCFRCGYNSKRKDLWRRHLTKKKFVKQSF